jgi:hypothetical protein
MKFQLIVACELLLGSDNASVDLDFSFMISVAQDMEEPILKIFLTCLHNGQNNKV